MTRGAAIDFLQKRFGGLLAYRLTTVTVGTTAVSVVGANAERVHLSLISLGTDPIKVSPSSEVTVSAGFHVGAAGGFVSFNVEEDGILPTLPWFGISAAVSQTCFIVEVYRDTVTPEPPVSS